MWGFVWEDKMKLMSLAGAMLAVNHLTTGMYHYTLEKSQGNTLAVEYKEEKVPQFSELIVSWNAQRPLKGKYAIYVSLKTSQWSPWLLYAVWGVNQQKTFSEK